MMKAAAEKLYRELRSFQKFDSILWEDFEVGSHGFFIGKQNNNRVYLKKENKVYTVCLFDVKCIQQQIQEEKTFSLLTDVVNYICELPNFLYDDCHKKIYCEQQNEIQKKFQKTEDWLKQMEAIEKENEKRFAEELKNPCETIAQTQVKTWSKLVLPRKVGATYYWNTPAERQSDWNYLMKEYGKDCLVSQSYNGEIRDNYEHYEAFCEELEAAGF